MSQLEIIHLRASGEPIEAIAERIKESSASVQQDVDVIVVYRQVGLDTDLALHLHHRTLMPGEGASPSGLRLAAALSGYGLVEHTVWKELA